jgi:hypothetical protein
MSFTAPIHAILTESAYSAAYAIASAADRISVPRTGGVGSVGVITMHLDWTQRIKDDGLKVTIITYGSVRLRFPLRELSDEALAAIQQDINTMGELFVNTVARNRGLAQRLSKVLRPPVLWLLMVWNLDWLMRYVLLMLRSETYLKKQEPEMARKRHLVLLTFLRLLPKRKRIKKPKSERPSRGRG